MARVEITLKSGVTTFAKVEEFRVQKVGNLTTGFTWKGVPPEPGRSSRDLVYLDVNEVAAVVFVDRVPAEEEVSDAP